MSTELLAGHLSRREMLVSASAAALMGAASSAMATGGLAPRRSAAEPEPLAPLALAVVQDEVPAVSIRRYMAAAVALLDGRILITGGYNRRSPDNEPVMPLRSALIVHPGTGTVVHTAPMRVARARHAAVALPDGRIAVIGGVGLMNPTGAVEVYDSRSNRWEIVGSLSLPRYDHVAVATGWQVCVLGGHSQAQLSSSEILNFTPATSYTQP